MSLGTMAKSAAQSANVDPSSPIYFDWVSFLGDDSYPTGGTTGLDALLQALTEDGRDVINLIPGDCGGYVPAYLNANGGTLKVYYADYDAVADGALIEVPNTTDLSSVTFNVMLISK